LPIGSGIDRILVPEHEAAIARGPDVDFDEIGSPPDGRFDRRDRIFGVGEMFAAMRDHGEFWRGCRHPGEASDARAWRRVRRGRAGERVWANGSMAK